MAETHLYGPFADWENAKDYPIPKNTESRTWSWEFLRRNPEYQYANNINWAVNQPLLMVLEKK